MVRQKSDNQLGLSDEFGDFAVAKIGDC